MQSDKLSHLLAGIALAALPTAYGLPYWIGFGLATLAGAAKEFWDMRGNGTPDKWDFVVTVLGGATVLPLGIDI